MTGQASLTEFTLSSRIRDIAARGREAAERQEVTVDEQ